MTMENVIWHQCLSERVSVHRPQRATVGGRPRLAVVVATVVLLYNLFMALEIINQETELDAVFQFQVYM